MVEAVLVDLDGAACAVARQKAQALAANRKHLEVFHGDVTSSVSAIKDYLLQLRKEGRIDGIVCSIYSVLHELFSRSPNFKENSFFGQLFWDWNPCIFVGREPCAPCNWPENVEFAVAGLTSDDLATLAGDVRTRLKFDSDIIPVDPGHICVSSDLAVECLFKLFHIDNYAHEVEERLTKLQAGPFVSMIERHLGCNSVIESRLNSDGFIARYRAHGISARTVDGQPLPLPLCFTSLFGQRAASNFAVSPRKRSDLNVAALVRATVELHDRALDQSDASDASALLSLSGRGANGSARSHSLGTGED